MNPLSFYAKSNGLSLHEHTAHVAEACRNLLDSLCISENERQGWFPIIYDCAVLHDIGKIHRYFQENLKNNYPVYTIRHEVISLWICTTFLEALSNGQLFAIATHHKGIINLHAGDASARLNSTSFEMLMRDHIPNDLELLQKMPEFLSFWTEYFATNLTIRPNTERAIVDTLLPRQILWLLNRDFQKRALTSPKDRLRLSETRALLIASDHIGSARKEMDFPVWKKLEVDDFKPREHDLRAFQLNLLTVKGDALLYAPTGSGKTEAALCWLVANQQPNGRFIYLLPYTASINAMTTRMEKIFGENRVTALHSKTIDFFYDRIENEADNYMDEEGNVLQERERHARNATRARSLSYISKELFYPVKIATPHQLLRYALNGKGWEMGLFDFRNACIVVDEFHAYEPLFTGLLFATIKWLKNEYFGAKVLLMSATIPAFLQQLILNSLFEGNQNKFYTPLPSASSDLEILDRKRHILSRCSGVEICDYISSIEKELNLGRNVLVVVNNVATCQMMFEHIKFEGHKKMLHSGFHRIDRNLIEKAITHEDRANRPQLLIATQAVEVSLDIDYDMAFIENAPIDALIQRFGRVNRSGKKGIVPIYLFENIIGNTPFYDSFILERTWEVIGELEGVALSETDLVDACNKVYENGYSEAQLMEFNQGFGHPNIAGFFEQLIAGDWRDWIEDAIENKNKKVDVLCENLVEKFSEFKKIGDFIRASQLLVSVYWYEVSDGIINDINLGVKVTGKLNYPLKNGSSFLSDTGYVRIKETFDDRMF